MGLNLNGIQITDSSGGFNVNNGTFDVMNMDTNGKVRIHRQPASTAGIADNNAKYYTGNVDFDAVYSTGAADDFLGTTTSGTAGGMNLTNNKYYAPIAGLYLIQFWSIVYPDGNNRWHGYISINGGTWSSAAPTYTAYHYAAGGSWKTAHATVTYPASAGDNFGFTISDSGQWHGGFHSGFCVTYLG
jgi:hypothetical protein